MENCNLLSHPCANISFYPDLLYPEAHVYTSQGDSRIENKTHPEEDVCTSQGEAKSRLEAWTIPFVISPRGAKMVGSQASTSPSAD